MKKFILQTPASSANLGSGLDALGLGLNLHNCFYFKLNSSGDFSFQFKNPKAISANYDSKIENNLVFKAYRYACEQKGFKIQALSVFCDNKIPDSSGLGSSTTAICAGLLAAFIFNDYPLNKKTKLEALQLGLYFEPHPDNLAPCLFGGFCIGVMNETKTEVFLKNFSLKNKDLKAFVILPSNLRVLTDQSRKNLPKNIHLDQAIFNLSRSALLTASFISQDYQNLKISMQDSLHQQSRFQSEQNYPNLLNQLEKNKHFYAMSLSGSGPSLLILAKPQLKLAPIIDKVFQQKPIVYNLNFDNQGLRLIK